MSKSPMVHPVRPGNVVLVTLSVGGRRSAPTGRVTAVHGPFKHPINSFTDKDALPRIDVKIFDFEHRVRQITDVPHFFCWTTGDCAWEGFAEFAIALEEQRAPAMDAPVGSLHRG